MDNGELLGNVYGRLRAVEFLGVVDIGGSRRSAYKCACKCGIFKDVSAKNLKDGKVQSCGCIRAAKPKTKDEMKEKSTIYSEKNKIRRAKRAEILAKAGYIGPRAMNDFFNDFSLVLGCAIGVNGFRDLVESALHRESEENENE